MENGKWRMDNCLKAKGKKGRKIVVRGSLIVVKVIEVKSKSEKARIKKAFIRDIRVDSRAKS